MPALHEADLLYTVKTLLYCHLGMNAISSCNRSCTICHFYTLAQYLENQPLLHPNYHGPHCS